MPTELEVRTDSSAYNANTLGRQVIHEEYNSAYNHPILVDAYHEGRARDINEEPKKNGEPCFILGSGASLDNIMPMLKDWKGGIICTTSHALSLMYYGIEPTYILCLDPFNCWGEIKGVDWSKTKTKLITTPGVWPTLIKNWPNEFLLYIQNLGSRETYYSQQQKRMYTVRRAKNEDEAANEDELYRDAIFDYIIRTEITQFACSPPCQMFAAQILGYGRIFLAGCDHGVVDEKERCSNWVVTKPEQKIKAGNSEDITIPAQWELKTYPVDKERPEWITSANGILTNPILLFYKKNLITAWRLSLQDVYSCDRGIITEIPFADPEKVIKTQGQGFKRTSHDFIIKQAESYLAKVGAFVVNVGQAYSFVEAAHPLRNWIDPNGVEREGELISFMKVISRKWECQNCHAIGQADDDNDWSNHECQGCHQKNLKRAPLDIEANVKKFRKLLGIYGPLNEVDRPKTTINIDPTSGNHLAENVFKIQAEEAKK